MIEPTDELIEKIARRLCVRAGRNPDEIITPTPSRYNGPTRSPYRLWERQVHYVERTLLVFEAMYEVLEDEDGK